MIKITKSTFQAMIEHAKKCYPQEACGFLVGTPGKGDRFIGLENREHSSVSYAMDPKEQMRTFRKMSDAKEKLSGIFHSHVASTAYPSEKDIHMAFYDDVAYLIVSLADMESPDLKAFWIKSGTVSEEPLEII